MVTYSIETCYIKNKDGFSAETKSFAKVSVQGENKVEIAFKMKDTFEAHARKIGAPMMVYSVSCTNNEDWWDSFDLEFDLTITKPELI